MAATTYNAALIPLTAEALYPFSVLPAQRLYTSGEKNGVRQFMAVDPVCKMTVNEKTARFTTDYKGKKYYFCAPGCKRKFEKEPEKYLS
jgi:YHS domain-containing protein